MYIYIHTIYIYIQHIYIYTYYIVYIYIHDIYIYIVVISTLTIGNSISFDPSQKREAYIRVGPGLDRRRPWGFHHHFEGLQPSKRYIEINDDIQLLSTIYIYMYKHIYIYICIYIYV